MLWPQTMPVDMKGYPVIYGIIHNPVQREKGNIHLKIFFKSHYYE